MAQINFTCGNYVERTDGAIYVGIGDSKIYFSHGNIIAISTSTGIYRLDSAPQGVIYKRIRQALNQSPLATRKVNAVSQEELLVIFQSIFLQTASKLIDSKLKIAESRNTQPA